MPRGNELLLVNQLFDSSGEVHKLKLRVYRIPLYYDNLSYNLSTLFYLLLSSAIIIISVVNIPGYIVKPFSVVPHLPKCYSYIMSRIVMSRIVCNPDIPTIGISHWSYRTSVCQLLRCGVFLGS